MKKSSKILSSDLVRYNANARGNASPDCVARGLSLAFNMSYNDILKELRETAKEHHYSSYKTTVNITNTIAKHTSDKCIQLSRNEVVPVGQFADENNVGTYVILCGKKRDDLHTEHLVTCIDGKIYDSWDSRNYFVKKYWYITNVVHEFKLNIEESQEVLRDKMMESVDTFGRKYCDKYGISVDELTFNGSYFNHNILCIDISWKSSKTGVEYDFSFNLSYSLKMSLEEALKYTVTTVKTRLYDRFYAAAKADNDKYESDKFFAESGEDPTDLNRFYLDGREQRFFNSLPAKIKPFVKFLSIENPGSYSDSVQVRIVALPGDPRRNTDKKIVFSGYDSAMVKDMINRYLTKWERPYDDYSPTEEY